MAQSRYGSDDSQCDPDRMLPPQKKWKQGARHTHTASSETELREKRPRFVEGPEFPNRVLEHQRHLDAWRDGHRNPRCVWTRSDANTIPISTDCNHTNRPLAKRGTILEVGRDLVHFPDLPGLNSAAVSKCGADQSGNCVQIICAIQGVHLIDWGPFGVQKGPFSRRILLV
jgi:hypothetical protein